MDTFLTATGISSAVKLQGRVEGVSVVDHEKQEQSGESKDSLSNTVGGIGCLLLIVFVIVGGPSTCISSCSSSSGGSMSDREFVEQLATDGSSVNEWYENEYLPDHGYPED